MDTNIETVIGNAIYCEGLGCKAKAKYKITQKTANGTLEFCLCGDCFNSWKLFPEKVIQIRNIAREDILYMLLNSNLSNPKILDIIDRYDFRRMLEIGGIL